MLPAKTAPNIFTVIVPNGKLTWLPIPKRNTEPKAPPTATSKKFTILKLSLFVSLRSQNCSKNKPIVMPISKAINNFLISILSSTLQLHDRLKTLEDWMPKVNIRMSTCVLMSLSECFRFCPIRKI